VYFSLESKNNEPKYWQVGSDDNVI